MNWERHLRPWGPLSLGLLQGIDFDTDSLNVSVNLVFVNVFPIFCSLEMWLYKLFKSVR